MYTKERQFSSLWSLDDNFGVRKWGERRDLEGSLRMWLKENADDAVVVQWWCDIRMWEVMSFHVLVWDKMCWNRVLPITSSFKMT